MSDLSSSAGALDPGATQEAVRMASTYPAEFLGLGGEIGKIRAGYRANLVLADARLNIFETWIDGRASRD